MLKWLAMVSTGLDCWPLGYSRITILTKD